MHGAPDSSDEIELPLDASPSVPPPSGRSYEGAEGPVIAGSYALVRELGRGTRGVVHEARSLWTGRRVALQRMHVVPSYDEVLRFFRSARAAARLVHPNLVQVIDLGTDERGAPFAVLELLEGQTLEAHLSRRGALKLDEALALLEPIADAVALAHEEGLVHGNVTPRAIRLVRMAEGRVIPKLTGFGLWRFAADALVAARVEGLDALAYRAPEQALDEPPDPRSDVWALAICLFRAITGGLPFASTDAAALSAEIATLRCPRASEHALGASSAVDEVLMRALRTDAGRTPSMRALLADLVALREEARPTQRPPSAIERLDDAGLDVHVELPDDGDDTQQMRSGPFRGAWRMPTKPLRLGLVWTAPDIDLPAVAHALHQVLSRPVHVLRFKSYAELVDAVLEHDVELGWLPPVAYVRARRAAGLRLLFSTVRATDAATPSYHAALLGRTGVVERIEDCRGKRAAWVDGWSAAGYLVPRTMLTRAGVAPDTELGAQGFVGSHDAVVDALTTGTADLGATYCRVQGTTILGPFADRPEVKVLAISEPIPGDTLCAGPAVSELEAEAMSVLLLEAAPRIAPLIAARDLMLGDPAYYDQLESALLG